MKQELSKEWHVKQAAKEAECDSDVGAGSDPMVIGRTEKVYGPKAPLEGLTLAQIENQCKGYGPMHNNTLGSGTGLALVAEVRKLDEIQKRLWLLSYELDAVLDDCHNPNGFDETCEKTIERVMVELIALSRR